MKFTKMHGVGNDYIYVNCFEEDLSAYDLPQLAVKMSQRHFGVSSDGLILIQPSDVADLKMRMFNNDGSEGKMCGNGARCIARYAYERGLVNKPQFTLETLSGIKTLTILDCDRVSVDMGVPEFEPAKIPVALGGSRIVERATQVVGRTFPMTCVSMGNPHAVLFMDEDPFQMKAFEIYGRMLENDDMFPERVNVEFVQRVSDTRIRMRVWERGSGETLACGTGACASVVAARLTGRTHGDKIRVSLRGGELEVDWRGDGTPVVMTGSATFVFDGVWMDV
ncbi:MAG: diaminopimelate epimerase [Oscillospiraceae bacterium]|nr:diaminopimelate epimerase [Oscillospiraceae bacterium]